MGSCYISLRMLMTLRLWTTRFGLMYEHWLMAEVEEEMMDSLRVGQPGRGPRRAGQNENDQARPAPRRLPGLLLYVSASELPV